MKTFRSLLSLLPLPLLALTACEPEQLPIEASPTEIKRPRTMRTVETTIELPSVVSSRRSSVIAAQVQARIEDFKIHTGQAIKAGEVVATLDDSELKNRLEQARTTEQSAQMEAGAFGAQAGAISARVRAEKRLHKLGVSSRMALTTAQAELAQVGSQGGAARAKALTARAAREQAEKDLARATIVAPIDGIVTNIKARQGEVAQIGTPLARVFDPSDLITRFAVPREHRGALKVGQEVELAVEGASRPLYVKVTNISGAQEPPINFAVVEADIDDSKLSPGELTVGSVGRVRLAVARGANQ